MISSDDTECMTFRHVIRTNTFAVDSIFHALYFSSIHSIHQISTFYYVLM